MIFIPLASVKPLQEEALDAFATKMPPCQVHGISHAQYIGHKFTTWCEISLATGIFLSGFFLRMDEKEGYGQETKCHQ
jgi:hypothetical protein